MGRQVGLGEHIGSEFDEVLGGADECVGVERFCGVAEGEEIVQGEMVMVAEDLFGEERCAEGFEGIEEGGGLTDCGEGEDFFVG